MKEIIFKDYRVLDKQEIMLDGFMVVFSYIYYESCSGFEKDKKEQNDIKIFISKDAMLSWDKTLETECDETLAKIAFPFAVEHLIKNNPLEKNQTLYITLSNGYDNYKYDTNKIGKIIGYKINLNEAIAKVGFVK